MKKVLYLSASSRVGGAEESLLGLLAALDREQVSPLLGCPDISEDSDLAARARGLGVEVVGFPLKRFKRSLNPFALLGSHLHLDGCRKQVSAFVKSRGIDLIHANSPMAALHAGGARLICHLRDLSLPLVAARKLRQCCELFVATSKTVETFAQKVSLPVKLVVNGVDATLFRPGCGREGGGDPYLLMVGNHVPWKRHQDVVECLAAVRARSACIKGIIAGSDIFGEHRLYANRLKEFAADLGLTYALEWREKVKYEEMAPLIAGATLLVNPAAREPFGRAVLEAMACATPVVAVDAAGSRDLLSAGGGILVPEDDLSGMIEAVWNYFDDPVLGREHGEQGRALVEKMYTLEIHARAMERLYSEMS